LNNVAISEDYLNITQIKFNNEWLDNYTTNVLNKKNLLFTNKISSLIFLDGVSEVVRSTQLKQSLNSIKLFNNFTHTNNFYLSTKIPNLSVFSIQSNLATTLTLNSYFNPEINHFFKTNAYTKMSPLKLVFLNNDFIFKFQSTALLNVEKNIVDNLYLVIKQKRFGLNKNITMFNNEYLHFNNLNKFKLVSSNQTNLKLLNLTNGNKDINFSNIHTRRLLRTRRILVLPTNINVTLITNSFDVVHS
jgi:hypothetical protein